MRSQSPVVHFLPSFYLFLISTSETFFFAHQTGTVPQIMIRIVPGFAMVLR